MQQSGRWAGCVVRLYGFRRDRAMNDLLLNRILRSPTLPAMPPVAVEVLQAESGSGQSADAASALSTVISQDQRLRDRILGVVNSPFFSLPSPCTTIEESVA